MLTLYREWGWSWGESIFGFSRVNKVDFSEVNNVDISEIGFADIRTFHSFLSKTPLQSCQTKLINSPASWDTTQGKTVVKRDGLNRDGMFHPVNKCEKFHTCKVSWNATAWDQRTSEYGGNQRADFQNETNGALQTVPLLLQRSKTTNVVQHCNSKTNE